jgi:hypothetical protein
MNLQQQFLLRDTIQVTLHAYTYFIKIYNIMCYAAIPVAIYTLPLFRHLNERHQCTRIATLHVHLHRFHVLHGHSAESL